MSHSPITTTIYFKLKKRLAQQNLTTDSSMGLTHRLRVECEEFYSPSDHHFINIKSNIYSKSAQFLLYNII